MKTSPNILIFEPFDNGHRMVYVRYLLEGMQRHGGLRATLIVDEGEQFGPLVRQLPAQFADLLSVRMLDLPSPISRRLPQIVSVLRKQLRYANALQKMVAVAAGELRCDYVFIPFLDDYCLVPLALTRQPFGGIPWGGIVIRPRHHLQAMGVNAPWGWFDWGMRFVYRMLLSQGDLGAVFCIEPYLSSYHHHPRLHAVPDPAALVAQPEEADLRRRFGIDAQAIVLLVYGYLDKRKVVDRLLDAMADPRVPETVTLLLVGNQDPMFRVIMEGPIANALRAAGRLVEVNRVVTDEEEAQAFRAADIVWTYYPGYYGSSGVMVRAGQASRPVVAINEGIIGRMVTDLGMGIVAAENSREELVTAITHLAVDLKTRQRLGAAGFEYFSKSTPNAFADPIIAAIAKAIGVS